VSPCAGVDAICVRRRLTFDTVRASRKEKSEKKRKKFQKGLAEYVDVPCVVRGRRSLIWRVRVSPFSSLRARTKHNPYQNRLDAEHVHSFSHPEVLADGRSVKACAECGFEIEIELI
jgi:hypothetical protein